MSKSGLIYVFTGEGKGKTSAALGVVTRALLIDKRVSWTSWYKGKDWQVSEKGLFRKFGKLEMEWAGEGFYLPAEKSEVRDGKKTAVVAGGKGVVVDTATVEGHRVAARRALAEVEKKLLRGHYFLVVMDEVLNAVSDRLIEEGKLIQVLKSRNKTHVVLTGRGMSKKLAEIADLVTECKKIKHPYDRGELAIRGLDY